VLVVGSFPGSAQSFVANNVVVVTLDLAIDMSICAINEAFVLFIDNNLVNKFFDRFHEVLRGFLLGYGDDSIE